MPFLACGLEIKFADAKAGKPAGWFEGYGSVFNNMDEGGDAVAPGAFAKTLTDWRGKGKFPKMLLQHGGGWLGGAEDGIPIGKWANMAEDSKGLSVEGQLFALDTQKGTYIHEGLKSGELDGLSIGYNAIASRTGQAAGEPERLLTEVKLWEVSVVTFPMNTEATVTGAKSMADMFGKLDGLKNLNEAEAFLRSGLGMSQRQAKTFLSAMKKLCLNQSDSGGRAEDDQQPRDVVLQGIKGLRDAYGI